MDKMLRVFVSSQNVESPESVKFINCLKTAGFVVETSPKNPATGSDPKWTDWYKKGLDETLEKSDVFIFVVDNDWDSSTWMAVEVENALKQKENGKLRGFFCHNPQSVSVVAPGMKRYLSKARTVGISDVTNVLRHIST